MASDSSEPILPRDALAGVAVGLSVSGSPDLARLGLHDDHLRLALGEVARVVLVARGRLVYGGRLDPAGYTAFLQAELEKYGRRDEALLVCLAWQEHRELALAELRKAQSDLGVNGLIEYLGPDGSPVAITHERDEAPVPIDDDNTRRIALTALRRHLTDVCDARVLVGGKRENFEGAMPGVIEEALFAIETGQPVFLAAGFGGATYDAASTLGLQVAGWPHFSAGRSDWLDAIATAAEEAGFAPESNGLTREENLRLAASHRASDVATLVAIGLGRLRASGELGGM